LLVPTDNNAPDPEKDTIAAVSWCFQDEDGPLTESDRRAAYRSGILVVKNAQTDPQRLRNIRINEFDNEMELINSLVDLVHELDPDILTGWEVQQSSWGYLTTRGTEYGTLIIVKSATSRLIIICLGLRVTQLLSRAPHGSGHAGSDNWSTRHTANFQVTGRHVLNVWRVMRAEQALGMYSFENFVFHILHQRYEGSHGSTTATINCPQSSKVHDPHINEMVPYRYSKSVSPRTDLPR
jgi:DNA polymerase zeta